MKKIVLVLLALFIAVPMVSDAGSVTSRWDMTIGGFVKFDAGWASQAQGGDYMFASPGSITGNYNVTDQYGNSFMAAGETRLNFAIKGPDGWGAKTSAFIEGDFRQGGAYEAFRLRHAFMKFDWGSTNLVVGQTWQTWGLMPSFNLLGVNELGPMNKGDRLPQIMFKTTFAKDWTIAYGLISAYQPQLAGGAQAVRGVASTTSQQRIYSYPLFQTELGYSSDACGKIGPWKMQFALGGFMGTNKNVKRTAGAGTRWEDDDTTVWGAAFKAYIPIIPEKKGNKAGALAITGSAFAAQGPNAFFGPWSYDAYVSGVAEANGSFVARNGTVAGGWGEITYYFLNNVFINGLYGYARYNWSDAIRQGAVVNATDIQNVEHMIVNIMYDVSPAIRMGIGWTHMQSGYANFQAAGAGGKSGSLDVGRVAAWYFF
ncbi:MAG: hypothetical protein PHU49_08350 [Syntrophorhabdaceae bacterium]|nr:hypothetical protein [Syntrophorhabdaceae bacterium]MDD5244013.1 hypothetical protein [Syntrophorhabdaceae bacterium]